MRPFFLINHLKSEDPLFIDRLIGKINAVECREVNINLCV